jgi:hypothetical protein
MGLYYPVVVHGKYFDSVRQASKELHICAKYIRRRCKYKDKPEEYYYTEYRIPKEKKCSTCKQIKSIDEFFNSKHTKDVVLRRNFNISLDQYNELFENQEGKCEICGVHQTCLKKCLSVDHDHATGKIRGLLCRSCNLGIGNLKDNIEILYKSIFYLQKYSNNDTICNIK